MLLDIEHHKPLRQAWADTGYTHRLLVWVAMTWSLHADCTAHSCVRDC